MLENIRVFTQNSIKISNNKVIYIDPYTIDKNYNDADVIFLTHDHYDHFSKDDIQKIKKESTNYVVPKKMYNDVLKLGVAKENILTVIPNECYEIFGIKFKTVPSYNVNKSFHPKENNWVGYILNIDDYRYYISGDTDVVEEIKNIKCDVAFVPIGGYFTMEYVEAAEYINGIKPKIVVPVHFGTIVGDKGYGLKFEKLLKKDIECKMLLNL